MHACRWTLRTGSVRDELCEIERHQMAQVQRSRRWSTAGVQIEWFSLFLEPQNGLQVPVREEYAAADEVVHRPTNGFFESFDECCVDSGRSKSFFGRKLAKNGLQCVH